MFSMNFTSFLLELDEAGLAVELSREVKAFHCVQLQKNNTVTMQDIVRIGFIFKRAGKVTKICVKKQSVLVIL